MYTQTNMSDEEYKKLRNEFTKANGKVIVYKTQNRTLPTDNTVLNKYLKDVLKTYNDFAACALKLYPHQLPTVKEKLLTQFEKTYRPRAVEAFTVLGVTLDLPTEFNPFDIKTLKLVQRTNTNPQPSSSNTDSDDDDDNDISSLYEDFDEQSTSAKSSDTVNPQLPTGTIEKSQIEKGNDQIATISTEQINNEIFTTTISDNLTNQNMPQTIEEFTKVASPFLTYRYNGEPRKLRAFIRDIKTVHSLATNDDTKSHAIKFITNHIEGDAEEYLPDDIENLNQIIQALEDNIKQEDTSVIEGQIAALRLSKNDYRQFAKETEQTAENYRRSLLLDKIPRDIADQMTTKKVIEICRKNSRSAVAKSVLESMRNCSYREVIASFITENDKANEEFKEKEFRELKKQKNNSAQRARGNFRNNSNKNFENRGQNNNYGNRNFQNQNRGQNQNQSYRGGSNNHRGYGNHNNRGGYRGNNSNSQNVPTIRFLAEQQQQNVQPTQNVPTEQFFRLSN